MTDDKFYTSLPANIILAKLTNNVQRTRLYNIIDWQTLFTWLWRWLPLRLSKRQSPATVLFRTTLTRTITQYELLNDRRRIIQKLVVVYEKSLLLSIRICRDEIGVHNGTALLKEIIKRINDNKLVWDGSRMLGLISVWYEQSFRGSNE